MEATPTRRPRPAWAVMALLALPFIVGAELAAAHQLDHPGPPAAERSAAGPVAAAPNCHDHDARPSGS